MQAGTSNTRAQDARDVAVTEVATGSGTDQPPARPVWCTPQVHAYADAVVAVLPTPELAEAGLDRLQRAGFSAEQCGLVLRRGPVAHARGLLARAGADGGPFDALTWLGVPGDAARLYQQTFEASQPVLAIHATGSPDKAVSILQQVAQEDAMQAVIDRHPVERQASDRPETRRRPGRRAAARRAPVGEPSARTAVHNT